MVGDSLKADVEGRAGAPACARCGCAAPATVPPSAARVPIIRRLDELPAIIWPDPR